MPGNIYSSPKPSDILKTDKLAYNEDICIGVLNILSISLKGAIVSGFPSSILATPTTTVLNPLAVFSPMRPLPSNPERLIKTLTSRIILCA